MSSPTPPNNESNGSTSDSGGSDTTTSSNSGTSITDLTNSLKKIAKSGAADVKLDKDTGRAYVMIITEFREALSKERQSMNGGMESLNDVGELGSAIQTKKNLDYDVTGVNGVQKAIDNYLKYLDQLETTIRNAAGLLLQNG